MLYFEHVTESLTEIHNLCSTALLRQGYCTLQSHLYCMRQPADNYWSKSLACLKYHSDLDEYNILLFTLASQADLEEREAGSPRGSGGSDRDIQEA